MTFHERGHRSGAGGAGARGVFDAALTQGGRDGHSERNKRDAEHLMAAWMERLLSSHASSLPLHRHRWFARDIQQFLAYCRSRGRDKLDLDLLAAEYVEPSVVGNRRSRRGRLSRHARL
ncbi:MAG TPA: hypothetical protein VIS96_16030 [Terrimicrobiaceae bacterium]